MTVYLGVLLFSMKPELCDNIHDFDYMNNVQYHTPSLPTVYTREFDVCYFVAL